MMNTVTWGSLHGPVMARWEARGVPLQLARDVADITAMDKTLTLQKTGGRVTGIPARVRELTADDLTNTQTRFQAFLTAQRDQREAGVKEAHELMAAMEEAGAPDIGAYVDMVRLEQGEEAAARVADLAARVIGGTW